MIPFHKIQTVFKRDPDTNHKTLLEGEYSLPEFAYLADCPWTFTEKVDGTNIRIMLDETLRFGGKTDNTQLPAKLVANLQGMFDEARLRELFPDGACLYGEGYGAGIQKGGGNYRSDQSFVLFDVKVAAWWLLREDVVEIGEKLQVDVVPLIDHGTLHDMVDLCRDGVKSMWGDFTAEGIVAKPAVELRTRGGDRIVTKLKYRDFRR